LNIGATIVVLETKETLKIAPNSKVKLFENDKVNGKISRSCL
jgi:hypothetical protein